MGVAIGIGVVVWTLAAGPGSIRSDKVGVGGCVGIVVAVGDGCFRGSRSGWRGLHGAGHYENQCHANDRCGHGGFTQLSTSW